MSTRRIPGTWSRLSRSEADLLAVALGNEAPARWEAWLAGVELDDVDGAAFQVLPFAYRQLTAAGYQGMEMARLGGISRQAWYRSHLLVDRTARLAESLQGMGVMAFGDLALHRMGRGAGTPHVVRSIELLVPSGSLSDVLGTVRSAGWTHHRDEPDTTRDR